ncbi:MAG: hypothetical protein KatS3mg105_3657 [Gemmatales bacterium]|nr:MAG: hypothetical protein KatS3mg105_3657 [Gemmatales bacterium]
MLQDKLALKELKRRSKMQWKEQKLQQKLARKEAKRSRRQAKKQQRVVVAYKALVERNQAVELLEQILAGLKEGKAAVTSGDNQLTLEVPGVVHLSVRGRQNAKTESVTWRIRWPRRQAGPIQS